MTDTMTAAVLTRFGAPDVLEVRRDWPRPKPRPGEVLVRVTAAAVNNTDIWTREGAYGLPNDPDAKAGWLGEFAFPRIQGGDVAGTVAEVGAGVSDGLIGRRVLVDPAIYGADDDDATPVGYLGSEADGGFAQYVAVTASHAHDVTASPLSDAQLACLPVAFGTARAMLDRAHLRAGETVLVTGASGGVGLALVQLAAALGARVVAITSGAKGGAVMEAGASVVVNRDSGDVAAQVAAAVPDGLHVVADIAGGAGVSTLMPLLRTGGRWVIAGAVAGPVIDFDLRRLYLHNVQLIGSSMHTRVHFRRLVDLARSGSLHPQISSTFDLTEIAEAQSEFLTRRHIGKIVLLPS
ncbi:zinc-binding dehydrogenase [Cryobacterium roopkundense]|uniref:NADPH:quinone reductase-like Zn-dependent oxidoreductase n=2 Tax=Cryobacterium roopkundense TaxID=1001240 RepID=A0A7W8ZY30_9MICO|nr:zinc-binding dehydrogenase [Cryobacterium roopkundense]MBB5642050.1 NADPH:quinone reductase-like Zn-dependent oxidoreductase [Cryobacterium roopkundense]